MVISDVDLKTIRRMNDQLGVLTKKRDAMVRKLRQKGATWTEVGFALGVSAQAAQQKYGSGDERSEAYRERAAARAIAKARKAARAAASGTKP